MSFARLYEYVSQRRKYPVSVERVLVPKILEVTPQDEVYFTSVELDTEISLGHIKQYRVSGGLYDVNPKWVTDIRYANTLNLCWKRFVCCKELMHVFDSEDEKSSNAERFQTLLNELEATPLREEASEMFYSENRTKWKALAVLCPMSVRDHILARRLAGDLPDTYDVALELRLPEDFVPTILSDKFPQVVDILLSD
jgi:hypothetical protein